MLIASIIAMVLFGSGAAAAFSYMLNADETPDLVSWLPILFGVCFVIALIVFIRTV